MTLDQAKAAYRRQMDKHGETVTVRRGYDGPSFTARARVTGYDAEHLIGGMTLGDRLVILLAEDIPASWPRPPRKHDVVVWNGRELIVREVDAATRRLGGETVAFELTASGA